MEELKEAIKNIGNKKQPGPDKIFPEFIKNLGPKATDIKARKTNKKWNHIDQLLLPQSSQKFLKYYINKTKIAPRK